MEVMAINILPNHLNKIGTIERLSRMTEGEKLPN